MGKTKKCKQDSECHFDTNIEGPVVFVNITMAKCKTSYNLGNIHGESRKACLKRGLGVRSYGHTRPYFSSVVWRKHLLFSKSQR